MSAEDITWMIGFALIAIGSFGGLCVTLRQRKYRVDDTDRAGC